MDTLFKQKVKVLASQTNFDAKVGLIEALEYFQDNMSEYFKTLNCDGIYIVPKHHAFWAVTKTKIRTVIILENSNFGKITPFVRNTSKAGIKERLICFVIPHRIRLKIKPAMHPRIIRQQVSERRIR